ncbi:DUF4142 domain-containing protein [Aestuariivirga sp.]|uniref:DUF4142 domain-containing protein n=1 Tax=Aestuariivirga sp. TaxID=2650926 RepID=UPI003BAA94DF
MKRPIIFAAAALLLFTAPSFAQDTAAPANDAGTVALEQMSKVTRAQDFAMLAATSDMFEIQSGEMAQKQGGNPGVQEFGAHLVKDHSMSTAELTKIVEAEKLDAALPAKLDPRHQAIVDSLQDAKAEGFDAAFLQSQIQAHREGIALFEAYAQNGDNAQLKGFAQKGLPVLKQHLAMAQTLAGMATTQ